MADELYEDFDLEKWEKEQKSFKGKLKEKSIEEGEPAPSSELVEDVPIEDLPLKYTGVTEREGDDPFWTGLTQGATLGFSDELMSRLESVLGGADYRQNWENRQRDIARLQELYPWAYGAGNVTGGIGTSMLPGGVLAKLGMGFLKGGQLAKTAYTTAKAAQGAKSVLTAAQAAKVAAQMNQLSKMQKLGQLGRNFVELNKAMAPAMAKQGAVTALGTTNRPLWDMTKDYERPILAYGAYPAVIAAKGAVEGALGTPFAAGAGMALSPLVKGAANLSKATLRKGLELGSKFAFGVDKESAKHILDNPGLYELPFENANQIAEKRVLPILNNLSKEASRMKKAAAGELSERRAMTVNEAENYLFDEFNKRKLVYEDAATGELTGKDGLGPVAMFKNTRNLIKEIAGPKGYLSEVDLHDLREALRSKSKDLTDKNIGQVDLPSEIMDVYRGFRGKLNAPLRRNDEYQKKMIPAREMSNDIERYKQVLRPAKSKAQKFDPVTGAKIDIDPFSMGSGSIAGRLKNQIHTNEEIEKTLLEASRKYAPDQDIIPDLLKRIRVEERLKKGGSPGARSFFASLFPMPTEAKVALVGLDIAGRPLFKRLATGLSPYNTTAGENIPYNLALPTSHIFSDNMNPYNVDLFKQPTTP